jgi:hypothetical protein
LRSLAVACVAIALNSLSASSSFADEKKTEKFALIVANHEGGPGLPKLRYAARDGARLADVLSELGGFPRTNMLSVIDGDAAAVMNTLDEVERKVGEAKARGDETVFLFYYSGHAQNGVLRLGGTELDMSTIKARLEQSSADVRLAFVDSCGAGAMTREKGGTIAPPFVVAVDENLSAKGQVIITSSSADEVSQESDDIQGSFFTHYLATGLRGDADKNHDGKVTLDEAYAYAYGRTVAATATTRAGAQHPTYQYDLRGAGDVTITEPGGGDVVIDFPADLAGRYFVVDLDRQLFVAEVDKNAGTPSSIALPKGEYAIKKRLDSHLLMQRLSARTKGTFTVDEGTMENVAFQDDYAKGTPIITETIDGKPVNWSVSLGVGAQTVLDGESDGGLFPSLPFVQVEARAHNLLRSNLLGALDLGIGSVQSVRTVDGGGLGSASYPVQVMQVSVGSSLLWEEHFLDDQLLLAGGGRVAGYWFHHAFTGFAQGQAPVAEQNYLTFCPGVVGVAGWDFAKFAHVELEGRASYLPYNVDDVRSLALLDASASVWFDF